MSLRFGRRPLFGAAALAATAAGCAAIAGFEELDLLDAPSPPADGGADTTTAADSATDGGSPDAPAPRDASRDAPIGCEASTHDFCDDFTNLIIEGDAAWTGILQQLPGTFARTKLLGSRCLRSGKPSVVAWLRTGTRSRK
jgi:hypothetical protein